MKLNLFIIAFLLTGPVFAKTSTVNALKAEIEHLKQENNRLEIQVGDLEVKVDELTMQNLEAPLVVVEQVPVIVNVYKQNRLSVLTGIGPNTASGAIGPVHGIQFTRHLTPKLNFGAQVQTNNSLLMNLGVDF